MYDPLWALNIIFPDIYPWSLIWTAHDILRSKMDNAIYTYEMKVLEAIERGEKPASDLKVQVLSDFQSDGSLARIIYYRDILKKIVMPPLNQLAIPAAEVILSPLASAIPEPMQQFLDVNDMFQRIVESVVDECLQTVLSNAK